MDKRAHDEQAALHAAREAAHAIVAHVLELDVAQELTDARLALAFPHVMEACMELEVLADREVLVEIHVLRHNTDEPLDGLLVAAHVRAVVADAARRRLHEQRHHADRRRLACAVRAEQAERLALANGERQVFDRRLVRVAARLVLVRISFCELRQFDHRVLHGRPPFHTFPILPKSRSYCKTVAIAPAFSVCCQTPG